MGAAKQLDEKNLLLDKTLVNAFVDGVLKTLSSMAGTEAQTQAPFVKKDFSSEGEIAGMIGMVSGDMKGTITVSFTKEALFQVLKNMLDEDYTELNDEVADAVGELTNIIYGCAKTTLNEKGYSFEMAIPTVLMGSVKIKQFHKGATLVIPFNLDGQEKGFFVEITVQGN